MFIPNTPQWWVIWLTLLFTFFNPNVSTSFFTAIGGALIVWWLEGRKRKREGR